MKFKMGPYKQPQATLDNGELLSDKVEKDVRARQGAPGTHPELDKLIRTIWRLRQEDGCPWDLEQTHESIVPNMREEAEEACEAIAEHDIDHLCEELGDVLEQVLLHAQIAADAGEFTIDDIAHGLNEKLVRRHPHVFGELAGINKQAATGDEALMSWREVKNLERAARASNAREGEDLTNLVDLAKAQDNL